MEMQGSVSQTWFADLDWLILSPKPPSSGMTTEWKALAACVTAARGQVRCALKIVVFDEADYRYARTVAERYPALPVYLQVGNSAPLHAAGKTMPDEADFPDLLERLRWLADRAVTDRWFSATVLPQLHVLAWGNKRGV
jgi:7-carboxy-7-deazaguanine synthase